MDLFETEESTVLTLPKTKKTSKKKVKEEAGSYAFLDPKLKAKELSSQLDWVNTHKKTEFLESLFLLKNHFSVAIRRKTATVIGLLGNKDNVENLQQWQLQESDRQTWLILESAIDKINRKLDIIEQQNVQVLSVSEAVNQVKRLLGEKIYTIEGELSEVRPIYQMYYFALKDKQEGRLDCRAFVGVIMRSGFPLNEGLSVRVTGKFSLDKYSKLKFEISEIRLTGEGELLRNLKLLEEKLTQEGLFDLDRKRSIKKIPKNILLLASGNSAALTDFTKVLTQRIGGLNIYHLPIKTQGVGAEFELLEKLKITNTLCDQYAIDTIVITRGGGSKDDLIIFNSEKVVRAIFALNRPSVVAIGHERDISLAELAADVRASTPSQAAELVSLSRNEILSQARALSIYCQNYFQRRQQNYTHTSSSFYQFITTFISKQIQVYQNLSKKTDFIINDSINQIKQSNQNLFYKIINSIKREIQTQKILLYKTENIGQNLSLEIKQKQFLTFNYYTQLHQAVFSNLTQTKQNFSLISTQIYLSDPKNILKNGYAILSQNDSIIENIQSLDKSEPIKVEMQDGTFVVRVD